LDEPLVEDPPDEALLAEPPDEEAFTATTSPPEGEISHHLAPNWLLPWPVVMPDFVSPAK
jgi:hypothetical protein